VIYLLLFCGWLGRWGVGVCCVGGGVYICGLWFCMVFMLCELFGCFVLCGDMIMTECFWVLVW